MPSTFAPPFAKATGRRESYGVTGRRDMSLIMILIRRVLPTKKGILGITIVCILSAGASASWTYTFDCDQVISGYYQTGANGSPWSIAIRPNIVS